MMHMEQRDQPLSARLRDAAIERTGSRSARVDDYVLDDDGVIDLRRLERESGEVSIAAPAAALATIRGRLGDAHDVGSLYDDSTDERARWPFGRRGRDADPGPAADPAPRPAARPASRPPISRLERIPLSTDPTPEASADEPMPESAAHAADEIIDLGPAAEKVDPIHEDRPEATCPKCAGVGHRDLFDRFSQVEFYSCDVCLHMWQQDRR
ncbi:MAG: hypothetical protein R2695_05695 [Acidimicrobiales bacterium]